MKNDESCFEVRPRACGVFSSFSPEALGILAAIKRYQKKTAGLVGFVKVEAMCGRAESSTMVGTQVWQGRGPRRGFHN